MKTRIAWLVAGIVLSLGTTVFAQNVLFTDQGSFESWYEGAVANMSGMGVITGYPDGSFGPGNTVNRAELAVMLDRFHDELLSEMSAKNVELRNALMKETVTSYGIQRVITAYDGLKDFDLPAEIKSYIVMAEAGYFKLDEAPDQTHFEVVEMWTLPEGYTMYYDNDGYIEMPGYLHYVGERSGGDVVYEVDEWYGPF